MPGAGTGDGGNSIIAEAADFDSKFPAQLWAERCSKGVQEVAKNRRRAGTRDQRQTQKQPPSIHSLLNVQQRSLCGALGTGWWPLVQGPLLPQRPLQAEPQQMPGGSDGVMVGGRRG